VYIQEKRHTGESIVVKHLDIAELVEVMNISIQEREGTRVCNVGSPHLGNYLQVSRTLEWKISNEFPRFESKSVVAIFRVIRYAQNMCELCDLHMHLNSNACFTVNIQFIK